MRHYHHLMRYGPHLALLVPLLVLIAYPIGMVLKEAFLDSSGDLTPDHLYWVLTDQRALSVISFTVALAMASSVLTVLIALPGAYLLSLHGGRSRQTVLALSTLPFVLPPLVLAMGFIPLFGSSGHVNWIIGSVSSALGTHIPTVELLYTKWGVLLAHIFLNFPIALRFLYQGMAGSGPGPVRASRSLGAGPLRTFVRVVLPQVSTSVVAALSLVFTFCLLSFGVVLVIGGLSNTTIEVEIYRQMVGHFDPHRAGALLLIELLLAVISSSIFIIASRRSFPVQMVEAPHSGPVAPMTWKGRLVSGAYVLVIAFLVLGPLISVVLGSLTAHPGEDLDLTFSWYGKVLSRESDPVIGSSPMGSILNSLLIGTVSTVCSVSLGYLTALMLDRKGFRGKGVMDSLLLLPIGISTVSLGFGMISASATGPVDLRGSWAVVVLVHTLIAYPLAAMVMLSARRAVPANLPKAARLLGDGRSEVLLNIRLPLLVPGLLTAAVLCFAISIGEMGATMMVAPPNLTTMPVALYRFISGGRDFGAASAYAVIMLVVTLTSFLVVQWSVGSLRRLGVGRSD